MAKYRARLLVKFCHICSYNPIKYVMKAEIVNTASTAWEVLHGNSRFMSWNLFLALMPLAISFWLFDRPRSLFMKWSVLLLVGATFLPNTKIVLAQAMQLIRGEAMTYILGAIAITIALMLLNLLLLRRRQSPSLVWWLGYRFFAECTLCTDRYYPSLSGYSPK